LNLPARNRTHSCPNSLAKPPSYLQLRLPNHI
jgi:hypothetical protein